MKYYTCFTFGSIDPDALHCTHKYLGELDKDDAAIVVDVVHEYFERGGRLVFPRAKFDTVWKFGPNKDTRVLIAKQIYLPDWWMDLRFQLDVFRKDDFPEYRPHVTTNVITRLDEPFSGFALIAGKQPIITYENPLYHERTYGRD